MEAGPEAETAFGPEVDEDSAVKSHAPCTNGGENWTPSHFNGEHADPSEDVQMVLEEADGAPLPCSEPDLENADESGGMWSDVSSSYEWDGGSESETDDDNTLSSRLPEPDTAVMGEATKQSLVAASSGRTAATRGVNDRTEPCEAGASDQRSNWHRTESPEASGDLEFAVGHDSPAEAGLRDALASDTTPEAAAAAAVVAGTTATVYVQVDAGAAAAAGEEDAGGADITMQTVGQAVANAAAIAADVAVAAVADNNDAGDGETRNGFGIKVWRDSSKYMGEWVNGKMTGYGEMRWADGRRYAGEWHSNRCNGHGVLTYKDGRQYVGEYKNDKMHGKGVYEWSEGARYAGQYREHRKHGRGIMTWKTGGRYEGLYAEDKMTGHGMMTWADGRKYEGEWSEGRCTGLGTTTFKSGSRYVGSYLMDKMEGRGYYTFADGRRYEGEYQGNLKHGRGVYKWCNGFVFTGTWLKGAPVRGFLLFPGGECAKTTCSLSSSSDACPDLSLVRLLREAQVWIDLRNGHSGEMVRRRREHGSGADCDDEREQGDRGGVRVGGRSGDEGTGRQDGYWPLVRRFRGRTGHKARKSVLQDACQVVRGGGWEGAHEIVSESGESGSRRADRSSMVGRQANVDCSGNGGKRWHFFNMLPIRHQGKSHRTVEEGKDGEPRGRFARIQGGQGRRGAGVHENESRSVEGCVQVGADGRGYSDNELDEFDGMESEEDEVRQSEAVAEDSGGDSALAQGGEAGLCQNEEQFHTVTTAAGACQHASLPAVDESSAERRDMGGAEGRDKMSSRSDEGRMGGKKGRTRGADKVIEMQEGDYWFYLSCVPLESSGAGGHSESGETRSGPDGAQSVGTTGGIRSGFNPTDVQGRSRLVHACERGLLNVAKWYIRANWASVNHMDDDGCSPLHAACRHGHMKLVNFLLAAGARVDVLYMQAYSPLFLACASGSATTAFMVCRAQTEALVVAQVESLFELLLAATGINDKWSTGRQSEWRMHSSHTATATPLSFTSSTLHSSPTAPSSAHKKSKGPPSSGVGARSERCERPWCWRAVNGGRLSKAACVSVLRVWKTWASSETLVRVLSMRPLLLSVIVHIAKSRNLYGSTASQTALSLIYAIVTHSGNGDGMHQLAILDALVYGPQAHAHQSEPSSSLALKAPSSPPVGGEPAGGSPAPQCDHGCEERDRCIADGSDARATAAAATKPAGAGRELQGRGGNVRERGGLSETGRRVCDCCSCPQLKACVEAIVESTLCLSLRTSRASEGAGWEGAREGAGSAPASTRISALLGILHELEELAIDASLVSDLPKVLSNCTRLRVLKITGSLLTRPPPLIAQLSTLRELDLSCNNMGHVPESLSSLHALQVLRLSQNKLSFLPASLGDMTELLTLAIDGNLLSSWPPLGTCALLTTMLAHDNSGLMPPPWLSALSALTTLTLDKNAPIVRNVGGVGHSVSSSGNARLSESSAGVGLVEVTADALPALRNQQMAGGRMSHDAKHSGEVKYRDAETQDLAASDKMSQTRNEVLHKKQVSRCEGQTSQMSVCAEHIQQHKTPQLQALHLTALSMSANALKVVPSLISPFAIPLLQRLDLSNNLLFSLPTCIGGLEALSSLCLHKNRLRQLPPSLSRTPVMNTGDLTLAGNPLVHALPLHLADSHLPGTRSARQSAIRRRMEQEGDCGLGGRQEGGTTRSSAWRDASGLGVQGDLLQEPPRAWVRWLLDELWELDRAKSQKLELSLIAFGPSTCDFKLQVLDSVFAPARTDAVRRVKSTAEGMQNGKMFVEHSRQVADAGGQRVCLRIAAVGGGGDLDMGKVYERGGWNRSDGQAGEGGEEDWEASAMRQVVEEDMLPARMLPVFVWQSGQSAAHVLTHAKSFLARLARSATRHSIACATRESAAFEGLRVDDQTHSPLLQEFSAVVGGEASLDDTESTGSWCRAFGVVLVCVAGGCQQSQSAGGGRQAGVEKRGEQGEGPVSNAAVVLRYFQRVVRAAARRRGSWRETPGAMDDVHEYDVEDVAIDIDIKGFYTLDASLKSCACVPLPRQGHPGEVGGRVWSDGDEAGQVQGVKKSAVVAQLATVSKAMLLSDRVFPDAFVPSSMLQFVALFQRQTQVATMCTLRKMAKTRCGIASSSMLLHHAMDLLHAGGHAVVLPGNFCLACSQERRRRGMEARGVSQEVRASEGGVVVGGDQDVVGWIAHSVALILSLSRLVNANAMQTHVQQASDASRVLSFGDSTHFIWHLLVSSLYPMLGEHVRTNKQAHRSWWWRGEENRRGDMRARQLAEELESVDPGAKSLLLGLMLPGVARLLLCDGRRRYHWQLTAEILARLGLLVLPPRSSACDEQGSAWLGPAHVPLLCGSEAPPALVQGLRLPGCGRRIVEVMRMQARWRSQAQRQMREERRGGDFTGGLGGEDGLEQEERLLRVVMRRVLGLLSLARGCTSHSCGTSSSLTHALGDEGACVSRAAVAAQARGRQKCEKDGEGPANSSDYSEALVWRDTGADRRPLQDLRARVAGIGSAGGLVPVRRGLWIRVETVASRVEAPFLRITVAREEDVDGQESSGEGVAMERCEGAGPFPSKESYSAKNLVEGAMHSVQQVADDVAARFMFGSVGLVWCGEPSR